jgi:hypothetical protein
MVPDEDLTPDPVDQRRPDPGSLGANATHVVSGFTGMITAYCAYLGSQPDGVRIEALDSTGRPMSVWANVGEVALID